MAEEIELDEAGNPKSKPVTKTDDSGMPVTEKAGSHRHIWQGMRAGGVQYQMCADCGKMREKDEE